jgi:hypothetical protein
MAEIDECLYTYLSTYAGLVALVSTRIYPDELPQGCTLPAVVYLLVSDVKDHYLTGQCELERPIYQFTVIAATGAAARAVANQLKAALCDYTGTLSGVTVQKIELQNEMAGLDTTHDGTTRVNTIDLEFEVNYLKE